MARRIRIGIDTGGTFTDVVAFDEETGETVTTKTPSTPADPAQGFMDGVHKVLRIMDADGSDVVAVCHGTTVATNQLLEGKVAELGFITTDGFEFLLEIARQSVPDGYGNSYFWVKPPRIVPADLVRVVGGRLDFRGEEIRPFDTDGARAAARWFRDRNIATIGVCLLHAYANPAHEERMRAILAEEHPDAVVSLSSQVLREYREYERAMTTLVDAAVKPRVARYVETIARRLNAFTTAAPASHPAAPARRPEPSASHPDAAPPAGLAAAAPPAGLAAAAPPAGLAAAAPPADLAAGGGCGSNPPTEGGFEPQHGSAPRQEGGVAVRVPFYIMKSNGGVLSASEVVHQPITTVLSGPAAGALGAALVAREAGFGRVLTLDGGGTSTDVSVVLDGEPTLTTEGSIGVYPSKIPMIDVVTVGAGGGSIAWLSPEGTLKVGPGSAGADPGPLCYRKGGTEPTVTDAHLLLGRIPPHLLGGEVPLDLGAAADGVAALGVKLGLVSAACAAGILEISAWNQANALRQVTVKRGMDIREFVLTTFGGSGSLLLCRLIDILGLPAVVVPPDPGNLSAFGLLTVDVKNDYVQTAVARHAALDLDAVAAHYRDLEARAAAALDTEGFARPDHRYLRTADLRYYGQAFEVRVPAPDGAITAGWAGTVVDAFHAAHEQLYGYSFRNKPEQQVEWVNLRVTGVGPIRRPNLRSEPDGDGDASRARTGERLVCFDPAGGDVATPLYWRADLRPGDELRGPVIIEEYGSTIPLHPGFLARIDRLGNVIVTKSSGAVKEAAGA